jgi:hypothetical protein
VATKQDEFPADDGSSKTELTKISSDNTETSEIINTDTVNNDVAEPIPAEDTDTDTTSSEEQQVQVVLPSVQTVVEEEPITATGELMK